MYVDYYNLNMHKQKTGQVCHNVIVIDRHKTKAPLIRFQQTKLTTKSVLINWNDDRERPLVLLIRCPEYSSMSQLAAVDNSSIIVNQFISLLPTLCNNINTTT
jgi:hypothetical protein